jgi:uncharacterized protein
MKNQTSIVALGCSFLFLAALMASPETNVPSSSASSIPDSKSTTPTSGQSTAESECNMGTMYFYGRGVPQSTDLATNWWRRASEAGSARAMNNMGVYLINMVGTPTSIAEGASFIKKASSLGYPPAEFMQARILLDGIGCPPDRNLGIEWLKTASHDGSMEALARMGQDYYFGDDGMKKDLQQAFTYIKKAAEGGNTWACRTLGIMYINGDGVAKDPKTGNEWLLKDTNH